MSICAWLTGFSGSGKSTTARAVLELLRSRGHPVIVLDGDELRQTATAGLGFSPGDRDANGLHAARLAAEHLNRGEFVLCALISPYRSTRAKARDVIGAARFLEVFIDCPLEVCEARDPKGLYTRARRGLLAEFTGIDAPYEPPLAPDVVLATAVATVEENARRLAELMASRASGTAGAREALASSGR